MKVFVLGLCFLALVVVGQAESPPEPPAPEPHAPLLDAAGQSRKVHQLKLRVQRALAAIKKFKEIGVAQIVKLKAMIDANRHCPALNGIQSPEVPQAPTEEEDAPISETNFDEQGACDALRNLDNRLTKMENTMYKMRHVGKTHIEMFGQFMEGTGEHLCEEESDD